MSIYDALFDRAEQADREERQEQPCPVCGEDNAMDGRCQSCGYHGQDTNRL